MKKADNFDAKQWLVENKITTQSNLNKSIKENQDLSSGLITFEQLKQACIELYKKYSGNDGGEEYSLNIEELEDAGGLNDLVNILDGMGFNGDKAYDFIFDAILKK